MIQNSKVIEYVRMNTTKMFPNSKYCSGQSSNDPSSCVNFDSIDPLKDFEVNSIIDIVHDVKFLNAKYDMIIAQPSFILISYV